jgi:tetratricopeptide (TPR) repeat protein
VARNPIEASATLYAEGRTLLEAGNFIDAIAKFEASIACSPHFKTLELLGEALLKAGEPSRAIVPLAAATTLNTQVKAPSLLAEAMLAIGDRLKAHEIAKLALSRDHLNKRAKAVFDATHAEYTAWASQGDTNVLLTWRRCFLPPSRRWSS